VGAHSFDPPGGSAAPFARHPEAAVPPAGRSRTLWNWARLLGGLLLLALLLRLVDVRRVANLLAGADPRFLAAAAGLFVLDRAVMIGKWFPLLRALVPEARPGPAIRVCVASSLAATALPASVGGEVLRAAALGRRCGAIAEVSASIAMERALGMAATSVLSLAALFLALRENLPVAALVPWSAAAVLLGTATVVLPATPWARAILNRVTATRRERAWVGFLRRLWLSYAAYSRRPGLIAGVGLATLVEQCFPIFIFWCLGRAVGAPVTLLMLAVAAPLALFTQRIPLTVWGLGISDGALIYLLGLFGIPAAQALAMSLLGRAIDIVVLAPGVLFWPEMMRGVSARPEGTRSH